MIVPYRLAAELSLPPASLAMASEEELARLAFAVTGAIKQEYGTQEYVSLRDMEAYLKVTQREIMDRLLRSFWERSALGEIYAVNGVDRRKHWEATWAKTLAAYKETHDPDALVPSYLRPSNDVLRLNGHYVYPKDPAMHLTWYRLYARWLFRTYFGDCSSVWEFGSGSAINITILASLFGADADIKGCDWSESAMELCSMLNDRHRRVSGGFFDMLNPSGGLPETFRYTGILTVGAMEQLGPDRWKPFAEWLLSQKPALVVNVEPVIEWYDTNSLFDLVAYLHHKARGYWEGFPAWLHAQEAAGKVRIFEETRVRFGSAYTEGYSRCVWRPM